MRVAVKGEDSQESVNAAIHGTGFMLAVAAVAYLFGFIKRLPLSSALACGLYGTILVSMYGVSTLSHAIRQPTWRNWWRTADQACIFLLIAASYTPFATIYLGHDFWWLLLVAMWLLAFLGVLRVVYVRDLPHREKFAFGFLGLLPGIALGELGKHPPLDLTLWVVVGGAFYLTGTIFLSIDRRVRFAHAVWHIFVIAGSSCHYFAVLKAILAR